MNFEETTVLACTSTCTGGDDVVGPPNQPLLQPNTTIDQHEDQHQHQHLAPSSSSPSSSLFPTACRNYGTSTTATTTSLLKLSRHHEMESTPDPQQQNATVLSLLSTIHIMAMLSSSFTYGCIGTTLFMITLPIECERISASNKSIVLGIFLFIAGMTQLISPIIGHLSDIYIPPYRHRKDQGRRTPSHRKGTTTTNNSIEDNNTVERLSSSQRTSTSVQIYTNDDDDDDEDDFTGSSNSSSRNINININNNYKPEFGTRLPYYVLGGICTFIGLIGQILTSYNALWVHYSIAYMLTMIGLNIQYSIMLVLIPDQIPTSQTGTANGILACLLVTGSIFGFTLFHILSTIYHNEDLIQCMYGLYITIVILTSIVTCLYAYDRDTELAYIRLQQQQALRHSNRKELSRSDDDRTDPTETVLDSVSKLTPKLIVRSMLLPIRQLNCRSILQCYTIDIREDYNFCIVTMSRLFYYCGMSVQTFFLFYIHDIIHIYDHPETTVASLAMIGQCSGALLCYPIGILSDQYCQGRRKPFIYIACIVLATTTFSLIYTRTYNQVVIVCIILGAANGMYLTAETSLAVDTLESSTSEIVNNSNLTENSTPQQEENSVKGKAKLLGIWGVAAFIGSALGPMIGGPILAIIGGDGGSSSNHDSSNSSDTSGNLLTSTQPLQQEHYHHHHHHNHHSYADSISYTSQYTIDGYIVVLSLSSMYFVCSAIMLIFIKGRYT